MKKLVVILFLIIDIILVISFININNKNIEYSNELTIKLDGISYERKIEELNEKYNKLIENISLITDYDVTDFSSFDEIITKMNMEYDDLLDTNNSLNNNKTKLVEQKNNLKSMYNKILEEELKKSTYMISGISKINQYSLGYPTGCESAALTVLLKYWGVNVSMFSVVSKLPKGSLPYMENNTRFGGNPYLEFVGNPNSYSSYGCYEKPIIQVANSFKSGIIDGSGMSLNQVLEIVKVGRPVIVWVSMNMSVPYISTSWIYKPTGEKISWMAGEHALVVVGYNKNQVIVSDSLTGSIRYYDKRIFESRYNTYGKRAVYY